MRQRDMLEIRSASDTRRVVYGTITIHLCIDESCFLVTFGVVNKLEILVLLAMAFNERFVKPFHSAKSKTVPHHSRPAPNLKALKAERGAKKKVLDIRRLKDLNPVLLVAPISSEPKYSTVARQVVCEAMCETPVLVFSHTVELLELFQYESVAKYHACMTAERITNVHSDHLFYITVGNFGKVDVYLPKQQKVDGVAEAPFKVGHIKDERLS